MSVFPYTPEDIYHLAATIFAEAAGEPWEGKVGVGYVARRRAELADVSIPDVVYGSAGEKYGQFSAWNPNDTGYRRFERGRNSRAWDESVRRPLRFCGERRRILRTAPLITRHGMQNPHGPRSSHWLPRSAIIIFIRRKTPRPEVSCE